MKDKNLIVLDWDGVYNSLLLRVISAIRRYRSFKDNITGDDLDNAESIAEDILEEVKLYRNLLRGKL